MASDKDSSGVKVGNPGSDEAVAAGCACPVMDNHHGDPQLGDTRGFWVNAACPLHGVVAFLAAATNTSKEQS